MPPEAPRIPSRTDAVLIPHLVAGLSYADVAAQTGVSERTIKRRMADPSFRRIVADRQRQAAQQTCAQLRRLTNEALDALRDLLDASTSSSVRLGASRTVLEQALRWQEAAELEVRLQEIELALAGRTWVNG
jgi:hypothetical protein